MKEQEMVKIQMKKLPLTYSDFLTELDNIVEQYQGKIMSVTHYFKPSHESTVTYDFSLPLIHHLLKEKYNITKDSLALLALEVSLEGLIMFSYDPYNLNEDGCVIGVFAGKWSSE